jgi:hypothetical protein
MKTRLYTISALVLATSLAFAQDKPAGPGGPGKQGRPNPEEIFIKLDVDGDGNVTLEEFKKGPKQQEDPAKAEEIFTKIDTSADGNISLEEFKSHRPAHGPGKRGQGKGGPGKGGQGKGGPGASPAAE